MWHKFASRFLRRTKFQPKYQSYQFSARMNLTYPMLLALPLPMLGNVEESQNNEGEPDQLPEVYNDNINRDNINHNDDNNNNVIFGSFELEQRVAHLIKNNQGYRPDGSYKSTVDGIEKLPYRSFYPDIAFDDDFFENLWEPPPKIEFFWSLNLSQRHVLVLQHDRITCNECDGWEKAYSSKIYDSKNGYAEIKIKLNHSGYSKDETFINLAVGIVQIECIPEKTWIGDIDSKGAIMCDSRLIRENGKDNSVMTVQIDFTSSIITFLMDGKIMKTADIDNKKSYRVVAAIGDAGTELQVL